MISFLSYQITCFGYMYSERDFVLFFFRKSLKSSPFLESLVNQIGGSTVPTGGFWRVFLSGRLLLLR